MAKRGRPPKKQTPPASIAKSPSALARWRVVAPIVVGRGGAVDLVSLETYCHVWARWQDAEAKIVETGVLIRDQASGRVSQNPLFLVAKESAVTLRQLEARLGIVVGGLEDGPGPEASDGLLTRRELAVKLGRHPQTVVKWEVAGMPIAWRGRRGKPSRYREADVQAWLAAREAQAQSGQGAVGALDVAQERAGKERWQARLAEQAFLMKQEQLLPREDVRRVWQAEQAAVRSSLLNSYTTQADRVYRAASRDGVDGVMRELKAIAEAALRQLADPDAVYPDQGGASS